MTSSGSPHVRCTPMGRTCGEPDESGLTAMGVKSNGPRHRYDDLGASAIDVVDGNLTAAVVTKGAGEIDRSVLALSEVAYVIRNRERAVIFSGLVFFLISLGGQAPHVLRAHMGVLNTCGEPTESN